MSHKFQDWLSSNHFSDNAKHLLKSSFACYRAETYSAALLMAYLGMLVIFKNRIMEGSKPALVPQGQWDDLISKANKEDLWEQAVFKATQQKVNLARDGVVLRDPIFAISDNIRDQIKYWKDRRNDCAHNMDNAITNAHVESFYSFLESNLPKITLEGGKATLLNKIGTHYDTMYTPANADVSPLVREIASAVAKSEMDNFFREAFERIDDLFDFSKEIKFSFEVLKLNDPIISGSLLKYLRNDGKSILKEFIEKYPSILNDLGFSPQEIRKFWTSDIKRYRNPLSIYASMLRNGLIPNEQIPEANEKLSYLNQLPESNEDNWILIDNGFGEAMHQQLFINHSTQNHYKHWEFMNANKYVYTKYIERYPLSDEAIKILHFEFDKDDWRAQWLQDSLDEMFTQNENKRQEVKERFLSIGLSLPRYLSSLNT